jgi:hypothetical protein
MLNSLSVIVRALFWRHNRRAALPAETLAVAVVLAKGCPSTDNGYTRLLDKTSSSCCRAEFGARERHESTRRSLAFDDLFGS